MFFNIDVDDNNSIRGWLAPDNPSATPKIGIIIPGRPEIEIEANVLRSDILDLGLHATGQVGFVVDVSLVPDIASLDEIQLVDAVTRTPIFRRFRSDRHLERKFFLFDSTVAPKWRVINSISNRFALNYLMSEKYPLETMIVLIHNAAAKSIFFCGRPNFNRYASYLESSNYFRAALLRDPMEELAERLLFLSLLQRSERSNSLTDFTTGLLPLVEFSRDLRFSDPKELLAAFRNSSDDVRQAIMSPMVRMFGCNVDELPGHRNVSLALDHLATLDVVGTLSHYDAFKVMLEHSLGAELLGDERPEQYASVTRLAEHLSQIGIVADLLADDLALYSYVEEAVRKGLRGDTDLAARDTQTI
jgi:hypothetical protein